MSSKINHKRAILLVAVPLILIASLVAITLLFGIMALVAIFCISLVIGFLVVVVALVMASDY